MNKLTLLPACAIKGIITLVLFLLACGPIFAADMGERYLVSGIGKDSCLSFIDANDVGQSYYLTWLSGYITSHNFHVENTYSIVNKKSVNDLETWLRSYCFANPGNTFEQAVKALARSLEYFKKKNYYDE